MSTFWRRPALAALTAGTGLLLAACGTGTEIGPTPMTAPVQAPSPQDQAGTAALAAYTDYWRVNDAAMADPAAKDWRPELEEVAQGQALESLLKDVENYASLTARTVGDIRRDPAVESASTMRVSIVDCVDLGDSLVVSDSGQVFDDLDNRVQRYRFRADVAVGDDGRWRVDRTAPALDEPC
jgi:hypothetical protein